MFLVQATRASPGLVNEDYVVSGPDWAVVLDGVTAVPGVDSGCHHGVAWLVRSLAGALARGLVAGDRPLAEVLYAAIGQTRAAHAGSCDLKNPASPSATVAVVRQRGDLLEVLVLCDSVVVLDTVDGVRVVTDDRNASMNAAMRNVAGGFWVAGARPEAAYQAVELAVSVDQVRRAAVLTDGASRFVDRFALSGWAGLLDVLERHGPEELITRVRAAEDAEPPEARQYRRAKHKDDATAVLLRW